MASPEFQLHPDALRRAGYARIQAASTSGDVNGGEPVADSGISTQFLETETFIHSSAPDPCNWGHLSKLEKIARGELNDVYRAWDALLEREVALKLYRNTVDRAEECSQFGLREARLLARIRHSNVVTVYGVDHCQGRLGIWMEYIRGRTLEVLLRELGPLDAREAALIGFDICSAVSAAHEQALLHRDITAKNVMREDGGRIVLMDFGFGQDLRRTSTDSAPRICGTPLYMAPELLRGEPSSVQTEIYSIGILLYRLVTGGFPVEAPSLIDIRTIHERGETKLLRDRRPALPEAFLRVVERSLSLDAAKRFPTAGQMAKALSTFLCGS